MTSSRGASSRCTTRWPRPEASMPAVELRSGAWYGDRTVTLTFPTGWDVRVMESTALPALTAAQAREALRQPIGTPRLAELARGKQRVAILIDDIMRPTPT